MSELNHQSEVKDFNERRELKEQDVEAGKTSDLFSEADSKVVESLNKGKHELDGVQAATPLIGNEVSFSGHCRDKCLKCGVETITWH